VLAYNLRPTMLIFMAMALVDRKVTCSVQHLMCTTIGAQKSAAYRGGAPQSVTWRPAQFEEGRLRGGSSGISAQQRRRSGEL